LRFLFAAKLHHNPMSSISSYFSKLRLQEASPALYATAMAMLIAALISGFLAIVDPRLFQGVSTWVKPLKFQLSTVIYLLTLALFMSWLPAQKRNSWLARYVVWSAVVAGVFEVVYITWQGALGLPSHYNRTSSFYATMYTLMGVVAISRRLVKGASWTVAG
jgi:hypothetical protein